MARIAVTFDDKDTGVEVLVRHEYPPGEVLTPAEKTVQNVQAVLKLLGELTENARVDRV